MWHPEIMHRSGPRRRRHPQATDHTTEN